MDLILSLRQMMAESKFFEVQCETHTQLSLNQSTHRIDIIELHLDSLEAQKKKLSSSLVIELIENYLTKDLSKSISWLNKLSEIDKKINFRKVKFFQIQIAEKQGQLQELYDHISEYQIYLYELRAPAFPEMIKEFSDKYFKNDYQLKLQLLALYLSLGNSSKSELLVKEILYSSIEKSSPKGIKEKLASLYNVLNAHPVGSLDVYTNFCLLSINGMSAKKDLKKIAEMIIYFEEYKLQVLVLDLLYKNFLFDEVALYASSIRENSEYDYVYLDKYFSHLKQYFFKLKKAPEIQENKKIELDLSLDKNFKETTKVHHIADDSFEEVNLLEHLVKYQDYSTHELCEIAVSFLQSEFPRISLVASDLALSKSVNDEDYLKASYLKLTSLLLLGDFRAALDVALYALGKARNQDDILSFMYGQAEAYIRLNERRKAKSILGRIISIDSTYRLAKERFDKINEI